MKNKSNPFLEFVKRSENNRKKAIPKEIINEINELSREIEKEESLKNKKLKKK